MDPLSAGELRGVWCTALLPIRNDDTIDWPRLADDVDYVVAAWPDGVYVHGSAGEFQTLDPAEYERVSTLAADRCARAGVPYQIGAGHPSGQLSLERIAFARALAPAAIQVVLPDWLPLSPVEVVDAMRAFAAAAAPVPLVLYNPPHAETVVAPETYATLAADVPELIGIKVAGGDGDWHARMRAAAPRRTCTGARRSSSTDRSGPAAAGIQRARGGQIPGRDRRLVGRQHSSPLATPLDPRSCRRGGATRGVRPDPGTTGRLGRKTGPSPVPCPARSPTATETLRLSFRFLDRAHDRLRRWPRIVVPVANLARFEWLTISILSL